ncbi:LysM peptidoglycan-binding domain-containing protein [Mycoplasmatota bacterium]|nr:LysM peptidoglycan-binding domain-containing protein [Mycoplasmatota bacterium]
MSSLYKTKPGDTIHKIIEKYNSSFKEFEQLNDLKKFKLLKGQKVFIPTTNNSSIKLKELMIKNNETIDVFISKYKISYEEFKYFNNLLQLILEKNQGINIVYQVISPVANEFEDE